MYVIARPREATVHVTLNKLTALRILRGMRTDVLAMGVPSARCDATAPDPSPRKRWTRSAFDLAFLGECADYSDARPLDIVVTSADQRLRMRSTSCTVYTQGLPEGSFMPVSEDVSISAPELLFVELSRMLDLPHLVLLGMELCGSFSRDPLDPRDGEVVFGVSPVTSVERIRSFCSEAKGLWGLERAREALAYVRDNAWAPTEAMIATMLLLPVVELGYGFRDIALNKRILTPEGLSNTLSADSRVPDLILTGSNAGINYDGGFHLDLDSIADAVTSAAEVPGDKDLQQALAQAKRRVREKVVDDFRRNRELLADGAFVIPVTKEDVAAKGGLDTVVRQLIEIAERDGLDCAEQRKVLRSATIAKARQKLIWSLLPGARGRQYGKLLVERQRRMFAPLVFGGFDNSGEARARQ